MYDAKAEGAHDYLIMIIRDVEFSQIVVIVLTIYGRSLCPIKLNVISNFMSISSESFWLGCPIMCLLHIIFLHFYPSIFHPNSVLRVASHFYQLRTFQKTLNLAILSQYGADFRMIRVFYWMLIFSAPREGVVIS
jgi:hypothetical protein